MSRRKKRRHPWGLKHFVSLYQQLLGHQVEERRHGQSQHGLHPWARHIKGMLDQPGTVFIAVGAAHLAGPDSVQAQLAKLGVSSERE